MKKIYLTFTVLAVSASAFAQSFMTQEITSAVQKDIVLPVHNSALTPPSDTIGFDDFGTELWLYGSNSGFVFGTSDLEFEVQPGVMAHQLNYEFARGFIANGNNTVLGAMILFAHKEDASGGPANINVNTWSVAANMALLDLNSQTPTEDGPEQAVATESLSFADADTAGFTFVNFSTPALVSGDFAISVDIEPLYGAPADTLVLYADQAGSSDGSYTWTKLGFDLTPGTYFWALTTGMLQGGLDVNPAIFAIIVESSVGIEEQGYVSGVKMTTYPNPALSSDNVTIQYGLETAAKNVELNIVDLNGKIVFTAVEGAKASGIYNLNVPAGKLAAGSYIYTIDADGARIAKRMEILK